MGVAFALVFGAGCCRAEPAFVEFTISGDSIMQPLGGLKGDASRGLEIIRDRRTGNCLICHALPLDDEPFQGDLGSPLTGVGARLTEGQIRLRLVDQSKVNPGTLMPPYYRIDDLVNVAQNYAGKPALDTQQIEDVVAYLASLKN